MNLVPSHHRHATRYQTRQLTALPKWLLKTDHDIDAPKYKRHVLFQRSTLEGGGVRRRE